MSFIHNFVESFKQAKQKAYEAQQAKERDYVEPDVLEETAASRRALRNKHNHDALLERRKEAALEVLFPAQETNSNQGDGFVRINQVMPLVRLAFPWFHPIFDCQITCNDQEVVICIQLTNNTRLQIQAPHSPNCLGVISIQMSNTYTIEVSDKEWLSTSNENELLGYFSALASDWQGDWLNMFELYEVNYPPLSPPHPVKLTEKIKMAPMERVWVNPRQTAIIERINPMNGWYFAETKNDFKRLITGGFLKPVGQSQPTGKRL